MLYKFSTITVSFNALSLGQVDESVLNEVLTYASTHSIELIIVDNGSSDGSLNLFNSLQEKYKNLKVITLNASKHPISKAQFAGVEAAQGEILFSLDIDDISQILNAEKLLNLMQNTDCIHGVRKYRPITLRNLFSVCFNWIYRKILRYKLRDIGYNYYLINRDKLPFQSELYKSFGITFMPIVLELEKLKLLEIEVESNTKGKSGHTCFTLLVLALNIFKDHIKVKRFKRTKLIPTTFPRDSNF